MVRRRGPVVAFVVAIAMAACSEPDVRTRSAAEDEVPTTSESTTAAPTTAAPTTSPAATSTTTSTPATSSAPPAETAPPATPAASTLADGASTSSGDSLLPELGSADLDVQSYDLRLAYDPGAELLTGTVTITTLVSRPVDELALDATDLTVESVTVDGAPATFEQTPSELLVRPAAQVTPAAPVTVAVTYRDDDHAEFQALGDTGSGWYPTDAGAYVLNEPDGGRTWLPSNDHPSDKATWHFELTVPDGLTAIANGELVEQRPGSGATTWVWEQRQAMSTYLVQVLIGEYVILDGGMAGTVPLTNVALAADAEVMQPYFDVTAEQIAYFESLFGPYPLDRYGLAFTESESGLAMETQGRSTFARDDFAIGSLGYVQQLLLSHELAHQWFGDAVSPADWGDLWLNESFATYAEWLWLDHIGAIHIDVEAAENLARRQLPTEPTGTPSLPELFGFERYTGGAVVLHALRRELDDEVFFRLLTRWVAENVGTSRTTEDFIALAEEEAGRPLTGFFDEWLYAPSVPPKFPE